MERDRAEGATGWLSLLDRDAKAILSGKRNDLSVAPYVDYVGDADFRDHPWAQLVVAAALNDMRDSRSADMLRSAAATFESRGDVEGLGYCEFVTGTIFLGHGHLEEAAVHFESCREHLREECPVDGAALAHSGLAAYQRGELKEAIAVTERALAIVRVQGARRFEGVACLYLAFFALWTGEFGRADSLLGVAEDVYRELANPMDRFELPLVLAAQGVLASLRGELESAERRFDEAVSTAEAIEVSWYIAICLVVRAEFMAPVKPRQAVADARNAWEQLVAMGDRWWAGWALRSQGIAACEMGDLDASCDLLSRLLQQDLNPLERGLTLLALGESLVRSSVPRRATGPLLEARTLLESVGARYWEFRCCLALAEAEPSKLQHRRKAVALADDDRAYRRRLEKASDLRITVLGEAGVWRGRHRLTFATHNAEIALYCLALAGPAGLHEEVLIERLWPGADRDRGRSRLRTVLWQIRVALGDEAGRIERQRQSVRLRIDGVDFDLGQARSRALAALRDRDASTAELNELVDLLSQPLLVDWQYEPWVMTEADSVTQLLAALRSLHAR